MKDYRTLVFDYWGGQVKKNGHNLLVIYFVFLKRAFYLCSVYFVTYFKSSSKGKFS